MSRSVPVSIPHGPPRTYTSVDAVLLHAAGHARNRLLHACEALSMVAGLALRSQKGQTPTFTITGARIQDASAGSGEQAAHVLAGQILIDGKPPWELPGTDVTKVAWLARFAVTSAVPKEFNAADSAAEQAGLKEAFRQGCERAWIGTAEGRRDLIPTYALFLEAADSAFQKAELSKRAKDRSASSTGDTLTSDTRLLESVILRQYRLHGVTADDANRFFSPFKLSP